MEIEGYENYLIYEDGKVQNKKTKRYLKQSENGPGYLQVNLYNNKSKIHKIHRLIALYYIPNPDNKICVDHINRNRTDNRLDNLRWATHSENNQNRGVSKNNKSGIKCICYCKTHNRYVYRKGIKGLIQHKTFKTLEEAIEYKEEYESTLDRRNHPL
tara:strand:+ start:103 stop:573 length:471 start_codon:yes stop_codon:yes gene_type:complete